MNWSLPITIVGFVRMQGKKLMILPSRRVWGKEWQSSEE